MKMMTLTLTIFMTVPVLAEAKWPPRDDVFRATMEACLRENADKLSSPTPERPQRGVAPTAEQKADRQILEACLAAKGIEKPQRGGRPGGPPPPPPEAEEGESSDYDSGEGPIGGLQ